jgi:hypothetical protein
MNNCKQVCILYERIIPIAPLIMRATIARIMPSIHRQVGKPNWVASFSVYDSQTNRWKQVLRSTFTRVFAREIVGHDSEAVSRHYTHLSTDDLRNAMQRLPDVTE